MVSHIDPYYGYNYYGLGFLLNYGLYGALCAQVYLYYLAFPEDKTINKVLVYGVYVLETMQAILLLAEGIYVYSIYTYSIYNIESVGLTNLNASESWDHHLVDAGARTVLSLTWAAIPLLGGLVAFAVQSFYAYRLRILARSWVIVIFIILFALIQLVVTIIGGSWLFNGSISFGFKSIASILQIFWAALSILCDIIIATSMTYLLLRNDNGWKTTHTLLVKLIRLAVETGTVTVVASVIYLLLMRKSSGNSVVPAFVLGKIYSNTMMVNFNHRVRIFNGRNDTQITSFIMPQLDATRSQS